MVGMRLNEQFSTVKTGSFAADLVLLLGLLLVRLTFFGLRSSLEKWCLRSAIFGQIVHAAREHPPRFTKLKVAKMARSGWSLS